MQSVTEMGGGVEVLNTEQPHTAYVQPLMTLPVLLIEIVLFGAVETIHILPSTTSQTQDMIY